MIREFRTERHKGIENEEDRNVVGLDHQLQVLPVLASTFAFIPWNLEPGAVTTRVHALMRNFVENFCILLLAW